MDELHDTRVLAGLLPPPVLVAAAPIDAVAEFRHGAEAGAVSRAVDKRRREFATGRRLAHELLALLGCGDAPLLPGPSRAPLWPANVTGSMAHCRAGCVVALARCTDAAALGVDIEIATPLDEKLFRRVLTDAERRALEMLPSAERGLLAKAVFCAKEAVYKAIAARVGRVLEFGDVELDVAGLARIGAARGWPPASAPSGADGALRVAATLVRDGLPLPRGTTVGVALHLGGEVVLAAVVLPAR